MLSKIEKFDKDYVKASDDCNFTFLVKYFFLMVLFDVKIIGVNTFKKNNFLYILCLER